MARVDLFAVTQAIQKIEDDNLNYKDNKTWQKLQKLRCEIELDIAQQRYYYLINTYAGDKDDKYYKELRNCEHILEKNQQQMSK